MRPTLRDQEGFTLIELLVVILIIGILTGIAIPSLNGQQSKGVDSTAKSDARTLAVRVEACYAQNQSYVPCTVSALGTTGLSTTTGTPAAKSGLVGVRSLTATGYQVMAASPSGNFFYVTRTTGDLATRTCTTPKTGGCPAGGTW